MTYPEFKPLLNNKYNREKPLVIAGPCAAESETQVFSTASMLREGGIEFFRAGVWKPRTKPGGFEGVGAKALPWLKSVQDNFGLHVLTEVANKEHFKAVIEAGIKAVWIGARTSTNPFAVQEIADAISDLPTDLKEELTVLVKNPVNPDLDLWIGAIQRISGAGIKRLGAIHRGFGSYISSLYRNQPRWSVPIELKRRMPGIPILIDPSHIGGRRDLVSTLSQQALDMNFDGLFIESHCNPDEALSDAAQQIYPADLAKLIKGLDTRTATGIHEPLEALRRKIDDVDDELIGLLARRMEVAREIGEFKSRSNIPVVQPQRYNSLMCQRVDQASQLNLSPDFLRAVLALIHEESVRQQLGNPD